MRNSNSKRQQLTDVSLKVGYYYQKILLRLVSLKVWLFIKFSLLEYQ